MKKIFALWILILFICVPKVEAKIVMDKLPLLTYAETNISVYDVPSGTKKGTIQSGNSLVLVKIIRPDGWAYGSYKIPNNKKRAYCWFNMNELQGYADFENYTTQVPQDVDAYRTRSFSASGSPSLVGKVASNEDIIVVAEKGDLVKIIFKADGNYYRMGWIYKNNLSSSSTDSVNITNSIPAILNSDTNNIPTIATDYNDDYPEDSEEFYGESDYVE